MSNPELVSLVTLTTDPNTFERTAETLADQSMPLEIQRLQIDANGNGWNAAEGLNAGLADARGAWVICAHQDVLFPRGWWATFKAQVNAWQGEPAVVGLVGATKSAAFRGHVIDPHGHGRWGPLPDRVTSLDEHVLILRRDAGLRFDPSISHFHFYGTDICLQAQDRGLDAIAIDAPVVHLSGGFCDPSFDTSAQELLSKWKKPTGTVIPTCSRLLFDGNPLGILRYVRARLIARSVGQGRRGQDGKFRALYADASANGAGR